MRTGGAVKGAPKGAFILTLDSLASHFTIERGTKRNAVQLSFVPEWMVLDIETRVLHSSTFRTPLTKLHRFSRSTESQLTRLSPSLLRSFASRHPCCRASIRTLNGPLVGPVHVGVRFNPQVHHRCHGPGVLLGAAIYRAISWTSTQNAVTRTRRRMSSLLNSWNKVLGPHAINSCLL